jgi:hypothetical protein
MCDDARRCHFSGRTDTPPLHQCGFSGAYTTFSSLALGDVLLAAGQHWLLAFLYLACSLFGGVGAVVLGDLLGRAILRIGKHAVTQSETTWGTKKQEASSPSDQEVSPDHVDVDDDMLLPEYDRKGLL